MVSSALFMVLSYYLIQRNVHTVMRKYGLLLSFVRTVEDLYMPRSDTPPKPTALGNPENAQVGCLKNRQIHSYIREEKGETTLARHP